MPPHRPYVYCSLFWSFVISAGVARAESALGDHEALMARWGWPPALACVMAYVVCSGSSGSSWF